MKKSAFATKNYTDTRIEFKLIRVQSAEKYQTIGGNKHLTEQMKASAKLA